MPAPRFALALAVALLPVASAADAPRRLALMEPEIAGDLEAPAARDHWPARLDRLRESIGDGLEDRGIYAVVDPAPAEDLFALHRRRAGVFTCVPCATSVADALDAERVLSLRVHRMSHLVLSLQALLRNQRGEVFYARNLSFRGDTDEAWDDAADYLIREIAGIPPDRR